MEFRLDQLADLHDGAFTTQELLTVYDKRDVRRLVRSGDMVRLWRGVYSRPEPPLSTRLAAASLMYGTELIACRLTAAELYGFAVDKTPNLHVVDPLHRHRHRQGRLIIHQCEDVPVSIASGRLATTPAWTAVELARIQRRPRALATLDAALRSGTCLPAEIAEALDRQRGRRGIVAARELAEIADPLSASPMESEARLLMFDGGLPRPELQFPVCDRWGTERYYLDYAWPAYKVGAEYDSDEFHSGDIAVRRDKARIAWLQSQGWLIVSLTVDDVRLRPDSMVEGLRAHLGQRAA